MVEIQYNNFFSSIIKKNPSTPTNIDASLSIWGRSDGKTGLLVNFLKMGVLYLLLCSLALSWAIWFKKTVP